MVKLFPGFELNSNGGDLTMDADLVMTNPERKLAGEESKLRLEIQNSSMERKFF